MSHSFKGGDHAHASGGPASSPGIPREATPAERATQARTVVANLGRWCAAVDDACRDLGAAATPQDHADALHRAKQALTSLRDLARPAPEFLDAAQDDATRAALQSADEQATAAALVIGNAPAAPTAAAAHSSGHAAFVAALPAADSPRRQQAPEQIARLVAIIEGELVFTDLDPLARALAGDAATRDRFERLSEDARTLIVGRLRGHTLRQRLLAEHNQRIRAARDAPEAPAIQITADAPDAQREVAAGFAAQLGVAPTVTTGEPGKSATDAHAARGVAVGGDVALHPDVDPASRDGRRVIAHEVVHQAQARLPAGDDDRAAAEDEADALAEDAADGAPLQAPTMSIDLSRPAADKDAKATKPDGDKQLTKPPGQKYRVFAANGLPYVLEQRGGRPGAWVVRDWVKSRGPSPSENGGWLCPPCAREVLTAMGVGPDRMEFAASALSFRFTGPVTYLALDASATHAVGLPPGQSTVVNRAANDALDVTVALDDPSIPPGTEHDITRSEMQRAVQGAAEFTKLAPEISGIAFLVTQAARTPMVTGNGTLYFTMNRAFCQTLFGNDAYQNWLGAKRERTTPDPTEPKLKLENFYQQPIPGELTNYGDLVESGERVRFEVKVDWPSGAPDPDKYAAPAMATPSDMSNVAMLQCEWSFKRIDAPASAPAEEGTASTSIAETFHTFRLGPGETRGMWQVTCHARFDEYFAPKTFSRPIEVKSTDAHMTDLRKQAFADLGTSDVGRGGPGWKTDLGQDHVASRQVGAAGRLGDVMLARDDQALDPQAPARRDQLQQLEAMRDYLRDSPSGATAVAALDREIARREDTEATVKADRVTGRQPFQIRGTYLSRTEGLPSGPLDLVGSVHAVGTPNGDPVCHVTIRDLSRRFEAEDFAFEGAGFSFDDALADAFHKLAVAYPKGVVAIEAEEIRATALLLHDGTPGRDAALGISTGKAIGFSRSTETTWKKVKETVWDPAVAPVVNAAAVALMTFLPFTAPFVIPTITAYNTVPVVDNMQNHADRGTLTTGRFATSMGEIALNVLPLAGTARVFTPGWFILEAANWGGTALIFHQSKRDLAESLQRQHAAVLAEEFQAFVELRQKVPANDPRLAAMEEELHRKAEHLAEAIDNQLGGGEANLLMVAVATALVRNMSSNAREAMLAAFQRRGAAGAAAAPGTGGDGAGAGAAGDGGAPLPGASPAGGPLGSVPHHLPPPTPHADAPGPAPVHADAPPVHADAPASAPGSAPRHSDAMPTGAPRVTTPGATDEVTAPARSEPESVPVATFGSSGGAPADAHAQIERLAPTRFEPVDSTPLQGSMKKVILVDRETGKHYLFKPNLEDAPLPSRALEGGITGDTVAQRASAAAIAAEQLGITSPKTRIAEYNGLLGSLQEWHQDANTYSLQDLENKTPELYRRVIASPEYARKRADIDTFDYLLNNLDRNQGNLLVTLDQTGSVIRLTAIDHDLTFTHTAERFVDDLGTWARALPDRYDRTLVKRLRHLVAHPDEFQRALNELLSGDEINAALTRANKILADVDNRLRTSGEEATFFPDTTIAPRLTHPSLEPNEEASPGGHVTEVPTNELPENIMALRSENDTAIALARAGYAIEQNPSPPKGSLKNPDYLIEGQYFDNYAPTTSKVRNIWDVIRKKVASEQARRIILTLDHAPVDIAILKAQFKKWPIEGLEQVLTVKGGVVSQLYP